MLKQLAIAAICELDLFADTPLIIPVNVMRMHAHPHICLIENPVAESTYFFFLRFLVYG